MLKKYRRNVSKIVNYLSYMEKLKQDYQGHSPTSESPGFFQKTEASCGKLTVGNDSISLQGSPQKEESLQTKQDWSSLN